MSKIVSKPASKEFRDNYDDIFRKKDSDFCIVVHADGSMTDMDTGRHMKDNEPKQVPSRFLLEDYLQRRSRQRREASID